MFCRCLNDFRYCCFSSFTNIKLFTNCKSIVKSGVLLVKKLKLLESHGSNTNICSSEVLAKAVGYFVSVDGQNCRLRVVRLCKRTLNQCSY